MESIVILVIFITATLIGVVSFVKPVKEIINKYEISELRRGFVVLGVGFIALSMMYTKCTGEYLDFSFGVFKFDAMYSTGVWTLIFFIVLYVSIFEEFHLNGWVVSKGKRLSRIQEVHLLKILADVSENVIIGQLGKEDIFWQAISDLNFIQADSVTLAYSNTGHKFVKDYCGINYFCKEKRIRKFMKLVIKTIDLK